MTWHHGPFLAFDTETSGTDVETDRIVTATTVLIQPGAEPVTTQWLIDPGVDIPEGATAVHGISTDHAREHGRRPADCVQEIAEILNQGLSEGIPVLAFNASFDLTLLDRECRRHGATPVNPTLVLDPLVIDKHVDRYRKGKRTLTAQCEHYRVRHDGAHDATADAIAAARVMWAIGNRYPTVAAMSIADAHDAQQQWALEQAESFAAYLRKQGTTRDLPDGAWPLRTYREDQAA
jgi:DNA polymerase-3 subunit epsilon